MQTKEIPKIPVQIEKKLKDYLAAFVKYQEMRKRPGIAVRTLDQLWRKNQSIVLQIEADLIRKYGKQTAEEMLEEAIAVRTMPIVA